VNALEGLTVLDLTTGIAGPMGVLQLAEHGADVIKVEPPGGSRNRSSPEHRVWDRSRRSVVLDLKDPAGREAFGDLAERADVLVESFRPGAMEVMGLDYESLAPSCPQLVYCSVPAYPSSSRHAHRPGWDALVQARVGLQYEQPGWREGPIFLQNQLPSMATAYLVPIGILAALSAREETRRGQHVETTLMQGAMALTTMLWIHAERNKAGIHEVMAKSYPPGVHQRSVFEVADGWVHTSASRNATTSIADVLGLPPEKDPNLIYMLAMSDDPDAKTALLELQKEVAVAYGSQQRDDFVDRLHSHGLGGEAIVSMDEVLDHQQLHATGSVVEIDDPEVGKTTQLGVTVRLTGTPGRARGPRPALGAHTDEVLADLKARAPLAASQGSGQALDGPLSDVRVLDFGRAFAGPFACMVLAGLGADVIKVTAPGVPGMGGGPDLGCNQGKRSIAVDLKTPQGLEIAHEIVRRSDVLHHNMVKGVGERLGIDYQTLSAIKPDIITCNTFMYGPEGPLSDLGGLDPLAQAAAGLEYEAGPVHEGNPPLWYRFGHGDTANALASVMGVLMALNHRKRTGEGQSVWATLLHATAQWSSGVYRIGEQASPYARLDKEQAGLSALYRLYEAQGGWIQIAAVDPHHWPALCQALGRGDLVDDGRFSNHEGREANRSELQQELQIAFRAQTPLQWRRALDAAGVPAEVPVDTQDGETILFDEENLANGLVAETDSLVHGRLRQVGQLVTFGDTGGRVKLAPPVEGQHTVEIVRWLGHDEGTIGRYLEEGIIFAPVGAQ
jgi:crotonobetainyl-CoA:carnitine CoA-transferase CaiB-like acyl-CoA transferase